MPEVKGELRLPPGTQPFQGARVVVRVEDVTYQDAPAPVLAEWIRENFEWREGPIEFRIDAPDWDSRRDVAISARLETQGSHRQVYWNPAACPLQPGAYARVELAAVQASG